MQYFTEQEQYNIQNGTKVLCLYIGSVQVQGTVVDSRAGYGARKLYDVVLDNDMVLPWCKDVRYTAGSTITVEHKNMVGLLQSLEDFRNSI